MLKTFNHFCKCGSAALLSFDLFFSDVGRTHCEFISIFTHVILQHNEHDLRIRKSWSQNLQNLSGSAELSFH